MEKGDSKVNILICMHTLCTFPILFKRKKYTYKVIMYYFYCSFLYCVVKKGMRNDAILFFEEKKV